MSPRTSVTCRALHRTPKPDSDSDSVGVGVGVTKMKIIGVGVGIGVRAAVKQSSEIRFSLYSLR